MRSDEHGLYSRSRHRRHRSRRRERRKRLLARLRRTLLGGVAVLAILGAGLAIYRALPAPSAAQYIEKALALQAEGKLNEAVAPLKAALQQEPDNTDARWLLSEIYLEQGQGIEAYDELVRLQELNREGRDVSYRLIRALLLKGQFDDALARLAFMNPAPGDTTIHLLRGQARLGLGRTAMARAAFNEALRVDAGSAEAHRGLAAAALADADTTEALRLIDTAIEFDPGDSQAWQLKGAIAFNRGDPAGAQDAFGQALARSPTNLAAAFGLIQALLKQQKTDAASRYLLRVLSLFKALPRGSQATYHYLAAQRDLARGMDLDAAEAALLQALKLHPEYPPGLLLMGWVKLQKGEAETARNHLARYHTLEPHNPAGTRLLAEVLLSLGQSSQAIELLGRAVAQQTGDAELVAMLGDAYQQQGEHVKAQEMLKLAVGMAPDSVPLRTRLAASLIASGEVAQGVRELATVLASHPDDPQAEYLQALALFMQGNDNGALAKAATLAEKRPGDPQPVLLIARVLERRGNTDGARDTYRRALERDPRNTEAMYQLARMARETGDLEIAGERFRSVLQLAPGHQPSLNALVRMALDAGLPGEVVSLVERARDANPESPGLHLQLADLYTQQGRSLDALAAAQQAARLAPANPRARLALGQAQLAAGLNDAALETLSGAVARFPDSADAHRAYAQAQLRANDIAGARDSLQKALALAPDSVPSLAGLAEVDIRQGRHEAALATARKIQQDHPAQAAGYLLEGDVLMAGQQRAAAIAAYETALEPARGDALVRGWLQEHRQDIAARVALAQDLEQRGDPVQASWEFERALQYQPDNVLILIQLARLKGRAGEPQALDHARRAHELLPDDPQVQGTYGWLLAKHRDPQQGLELLEAAIEKAPDNPEIRYHLAATLAPTGDRYRARKELEILLGMNQDVIETGVIRRAMDDLAVE
jgi:putative PEP-CTERM system TPR-repeat lipoprotein